MAKNFKKNTAELFISAAEGQQPEPQQEGKAAAFTVPKGYRLEKEYKSERMQLLVRPTTKETLKKAAAAKGVSMNDLVNTILDEYAEKLGDA